MKKGIVIGTIIGILLIGLSIFILNRDTINESTSVVSNEEITDENYESESNNKDEIINFIKSIEGVELSNIKIISNPVGFKGSAFVPDTAIVNGINYFLEETDNSKMENIKIESNEDIIITVDYKVIGDIKTPIEVRIKPILNENSDLIIEVDEVRFLDIKIAEWIVDIALGGFIKDWFSNTEEYLIHFTDGDIVIYKENFKGIEITDIYLEEGLNVEVIIKLDNIL